MSSFYSEEELRQIGLKRFGKNVLISRKASIYSPEEIEIANDVRIDDFCVLSGKISIGSNIHISVYTGLFGGKSGIYLSDFTTISSRCMLYDINNVEGNFAKYLHDHDQEDHNGERHRLFVFSYIEGESLKDFLSKVLI